MKKNKNFMSLVITNLKNIFSKNKINLIEQNFIQINPPQEKVNTELNIIDEYIDNQLFSSVTSEILSGTELTDKQHEKYSKKIISVLIEDGISAYKKMTNDNIYIPSKTLIVFYVNLVDKYLKDNNQENYENFKLLNIDIIEKSKSLMFQKNMLSYMLHFYKEQTYKINKLNPFAHNYSNQVFVTGNLTSNYSHIFYHFFLPKCLKVIQNQDYLEILNSIKLIKAPLSNLSYDPEDKVISLINTLNDSYNIIKDFADENISKSINIKSVSLEEKNGMNEENQLLLKSIENKIKECTNNYNLLSSEQKVVFDRTTQEHLPKLLMNYHSLPAYERNSIKLFDNKTPEEVLNNSLKDVLDIMNKYTDIINEDIASSLLVKSNHINNIKQQF